MVSVANTRSTPSTLFALAVSTVAQASQYVVFGFLSALAAIISAGLLTGSINTSGLLHGKSPAGQESISPTRVQLLLFTLATAGTYLTQAFSAQGSLTMPDVPEHTIIALGGSHALYLGTKAYTFFSKRAKE